MYSSDSIATLTTVFSLIGGSDKYSFKFTSSSTNISVTSAMTDTNSIDISCTLADSAEKWKFYRVGVSKTAHFINCN